MEEQSWIQPLSTPPSSTKNKEGKRDPEMHQTKGGNQWYYGMKIHSGADAGSGYVHTITATAANVRPVGKAIISQRFQVSDRKMNTESL